MLMDMVVTNEPARFNCGAPDYIITRKSDKAPIAFVEAKNINDSDLAGRKQNKSQFDRYKKSLDRIIFTDYIDFHFYENGEWVESIRIAEVQGDKIIGMNDRFDKFVYLLKNFANSHPQKIVSAGKLAKIMASKAKLLAEILKQILDDKNDCGSQELKGQYEAFKRVLMHDITHGSFADVYAQTIAYGMFAARMHDKTPEDFSRHEAASLIPLSNPFLRKIFQNIAGYDLDERIAWIVDDLALAFSVTDMPRILKGYSGNSKHSDPMIHFYEDFLASYDTKLRKSKGVWYTPSPVVGFIVRSVDEILKRDFGLSMGLADYSVVEHEVINENYDSKKRGSKRTKIVQYHRVQILDPAVGTGTFLAETINCVYDKFVKQQGMWQGYVESHLLPRLNGFEILMAPHAIAHLKLDWLLSETGYIHNIDRRIKVYLTNSLEEYHEDIDNLFSQWLSQEANEASRIKRDTPVMVLLGNPPYNGSSTNNGKWIMDLMKSYKKEPGGKTPLNERNPKWLNDDYVKFIRMAQFFIEQNGFGIIAYINPHGFLDNPTFRGMRWELLRAFDFIYTIDLHGNSKKKEVAPDGSKDENVFDIMQGVSINFFIKTGKKKKNTLGRIFHFDLYGKRDCKYSFLNENSISSVKYQELKPQPPMYFFVPKNLELEKEYNEGFSIDELFKISSMGITTAFDQFNICDTIDVVEQRITTLITTKMSDLLSHPILCKANPDWIESAKKDIGLMYDSSKSQKITYRPFDEKWVYYTGTANGLMARPRSKACCHLMSTDNISLCVIRVNRDNRNTVFVAKNLIDKTILSSKDNVTFFPLFIAKTKEWTNGENEQCPNFNDEIIDKIEETLGEKIKPIELLDYIYGVLHSAVYLQKYNEFMRIDFPRVPYPKNFQEYNKIVAIGKKLRQLHTMDNSKDWPVEVGYPIIGNNVIDRVDYKDARVYINETQYFDNIKEVAWNAYIGGYQPAQKWLKDRKGQVLAFEDLRHYREIIYALEQTAIIVTTIDSI